MTWLYLKLMLAYFLPFVLGYLLVRLLDYERKFSGGLIIFSALPVGFGLFTLQVFTAGVLGAPLRLPTFLAILLVDLAVLLSSVFWWRIPLWPRNFSFRFSGSKLLWSIIILILFFKIGAAVWQIMHTPVYEFDAWNTWDLRGKVIYTEARIPLDRTEPFYLGGGLNSYPLNDALWKVWVASMLGSWQEGLINLYSVVFYALLLGLFYFLLPQAWSANFRLFSTYALASLPFLYFHSWVAYADLELALYLFLAVAAGWRFLRDSYSSYLFLSAVALGLAIWTKNEGLVILAPALFLLTVYFTFRKSLSKKQLLQYWLLAFVAASPWLIFRFVNQLDLLNGNSSSFQIVLNSPFFPDWFSSVFLRSHFNFLWPLLFLLVVWQWRAIRSTAALRYLAITAGLLFSFYNGIVLFTDRAYDLSVLARADLQIVPVAVFLCALLLHPLVFRSGNEK